MALRDILKDAIDLAGVAISDRQFINDYNRATHNLAMLYDTAKHRDTLQINCTNISVEYSLDSGCLKIERVLDGNGDYFKYFTIYGNEKIIFHFAGTFTIYETFDQPAISSMSGEITINTAYFKAIAEFIAAKAVKKKDPDRHKELMDDYTTDASLANMNIRKAVNPNRKIAVQR